MDRRVTRSITGRGRTIVASAACIAALLSASGTAEASTQFCRPVVNPYPHSRYEGIDLSHIRATRIPCRIARRIARGAHRKALTITPPPSGVRRFTWHGWKVRGDLRGRFDSYVARSGAKRVRWKF